MRIIASVCWFVCLFWGFCFRVFSCYLLDVLLFREGLHLGPTLSLSLHTFSTQQRGIHIRSRSRGVCVCCVIFTRHRPHVVSEIRWRTPVLVPVPVSVWRKLGRSIEARSRSWLHKRGGGRGHTTSLQSAHNNNNQNNNQNNKVASIPVHFPQTKVTELDGMGLGHHTANA